MTTTTGATTATDGHIHGFGSKAYRSYVLTALLVIYILNFVDRQLLSVVAPQMKPELGISDTAFGLLTGFGFALLYTVVGIPLAQVSETRHRVWIMTICVALWSFMTALCGLAAPIVIGGATIGAFWVLLACRVGVGIGEAGCTPPANSLIADYFPPQNRAAALGYYAMGVTLGGVLANVIGGPVTDAFGWRWAFFIVGMPGVLIAVVLKLTVKEPPRGYTDPPGTIRRAKASFRDGLGEIASKPSFWAMTAGATIAAFCGYGIATFQSLFLNRSFGLSAGDAAVMINAPVGVISAFGTVATGWIVQRLTPRHPNAIGWLPGLGMIVSVPFYILAFTTHNLWLCLVGLCIGGMSKYGYLTGQYTIGQGVVSAQFRAVSIAILLFVVNLLGYGLGPLFIGALSDFLFHLQANAMGAAELTRKACEGAGPASLSAELQAVCKVVHPQSLQRSMLITSAMYAVGGGCFILSCRWLQRDMVAK
ncbi:MFS transporter [Phenylobacterium sp. SCN 70-31]|uniref:spinster family MFS transporter n=1 Tax=Phenylobacterium sp. SCN 70-31 TaxID=1660129 RepID=UPI00086D99E5|nr:MFS transporter [Phenylobacterium sp. SCN 70-31]ODT88472.1 MAG: MFS transporter [Phenylobacterium sp. SCN 70-31]